MYGYLPRKIVVFFNPGKPGTLHVMPANHYITANQLLKKQEQLVRETSNPVVYVEDRRKKLRRKKVHRPAPIRK